MITFPLVCIVDDAPDYRFLLQQVFRRYLPAYSLCLFTDGQAFLDGLPGLEQLPGLIILDRHMPRLDGHQTLLTLKQHPTYRKIPVVMMSTEATTREIEGCYEAGTNSFLRKSFEGSALRSQMELVCQYWLAMNLRPI